MWFDYALFIMCLAGAAACLFLDIRWPMRGYLVVSVVLFVASIFWAGVLFS